MTNVAASPSKVWIDGATGPRGAGPGALGPTGPMTDLTFPGFAGPRGPTGFGPTGLRGLPGDMGVMGATGAAAYPPGFTGPDGAMGAHFIRGPHNWNYSYIYGRYATADDNLFAVEASAGLGTSWILYPYQSAIIFAAVSGWVYTGTDYKQNNIAVVRLRAGKAKTNADVPPAGTTDNLAMGEILAETRCIVDIPVKVNGIGSWSTYPVGLSFTVAGVFNHPELVWPPSGGGAFIWFDVSAYIPNGGGNIHDFRWTAFELISTTGR